MPEFTNRDRVMIQSEMTLWNVWTLLGGSGPDHRIRAGAWTKRIEDVRAEISKIALELRDYNDQFEVPE